SKVAWYFGPVGVASIAAWVLVWVVLVVWSARTRGMGIRLGASLLAGLAVVYVYTMPEVGNFVAFLLWLAIFAVLVVVALWAIIGKEVPVAFAALILSIAAFGLGTWNSDNVDAIELDRTAEIAAARERQMQARREEVRKLKSRAADIHFAEDDANDAMDLAGYKGKEARTLVADANSPDAPGDYAYRRAGKKQRDPNKIARDDVLAKAVEGEDAGGPASAARLLPGPDYVLAGQLDMINRFAVRLTLVVSLILAAVEYLRRFNLTSGSILPIPIACRAIDSLWPKTHSVYLHTPNGRAVREYLETAVRKGESFICFAPSDPWRGEAVSLGRLPIKGLWPLRKLACPPGDPAYGSGFIFESAWFGRYCFVILADRLDGPLSAMLADVLEKLRMRRHTRATAARTLNILWGLATPPPSEALEELAFLCSQTNLKLVLASATPPAPEARELFEEILAC
ncbi:MAG: hypothetical protein WBF17_14450, partial [Phycisphaerae bacterium]